MKLVRENISFERGLDPKKSMDVGIFRKDPRSIKNFLEPIARIKYVIEASWEWINDFPELKEALEIKNREDYVANIVSFDEDWVLEDDENADDEYWKQEAKPISGWEEKNKKYPSDGSGSFQFRRLLDGSKVIYYKAEFSSGYIARKEWIK